VIGESTINVDVLMEKDLSVIPPTLSLHHSPIKPLVNTTTITIAVNANGLSVCLLVCLFVCPSV
jgi:hypothetical protein